jgi:cobalt-precorrin-5B (C1)-methyltransferase
MEEPTGVRYGYVPTAEADRNDAGRGRQIDFRGFTTGAAAAAAAKAAAELLLHGRRRDEVELRSPLGSSLRIPVASIVLCDDGESALATVVKRGVTTDDLLDGIEIHALVTLTEEPGIAIDGGPGVGRVTRPGGVLRLGEAAINPVPRQMIADAVSPLCHDGRGVRVVVSVPRGEDLAARTANSEMGIFGGIAILGTGLAIESAYYLIKQNLL